MFCLTCGEEIPSHSTFCLRCGSKIATRRSVPLPTTSATSPVKATGKAQKICAFAILSALCLVVGAYLYILSDAARSKYSASTQQQRSAGNDPAVKPSDSLSNFDLATLAAERSAEARSKNGAATRSATGADSAQLNSAASPATAPVVEPAPVRSVTPKPKQVEETFYITRTGKRYHRGGCRHLRYSAYPITRAEAEAQGYTPCRVCYP